MAAPMMDPGSRNLAEHVQQTKQTKNQEPRMWSLQWWVRQIVYALIVLVFMGLCGLANAIG